MNKYLNPRSYFEKVKWWKIFGQILNSSIEHTSKIHCSSVLRNSTVSEFTVINKSVVIDQSNIGCHCKLLDNCIVYKTSFGDYSYSTMNTTILRAVIGKFCSIASDVFIGPTSHPLEKVSTHPFLFLKDYGFINHDDQLVIERREGTFTSLGNDVWIGQGAVIMPGVKIGDGAIVGAQTLVTKNVAPYSIVVGSPAKHIRYRFEREIIDQLLEIKWWNWEKSRIEKSIPEFSDIKRFVSKYK
tara:strand:+ start:275 stop:1000 length:726 start_codon:yes stop_codon:yes gene_type:complete